jgi:pimeloyl-ACP methyl ester carboxylesterase
MDSPTVLLAALALLVAAGLLLAAWMIAVSRVYRLARPGPLPLPLRAPDGWGLVLYYRAPATRRFEEPVLLCHGLAANHRNLDFEPPYSVAAYLAEAGFECFSVEWRGTGASRRPPRGVLGTNYTIDDHIHLDAPAFLEAALGRTGARRAFWVGHSLGGLIGYAVAQGPHADKLAGLVTSGSPAFFRYPWYMRHVVQLAKMLSWPFGLRQRWFSIATAPFLGRVTLPLTDVVVNPKHIAPRLQRKIYAQVITSVGRKVVLQFEDWLSENAFRSYDKSIDYRAGLARVKTPVLITGGASDRLAPPEAVRDAFRACGSLDKTLLLFGTENGDRLDYGHGDLIFGEGAPREVYPRIRAWLEARATRIQPSTAGPDHRLAGPRQLPDPATRSAVR